MHRDDVRDALAAMAAAVPEPSADASGAVARGVRRIRQRRLTVAGFAALLAAIVLTAGVIASSEDHGPPRVASVPTTVHSGEIVPPTTTTTTPRFSQPIPIPLAFASPTEGWLCSTPTMQYTTDAGATWTNVAVPGHPPAAPRYQYPVCAARPGGEAWMLTASTDYDREQLIHVTAGGRKVETFAFPELELDVRALVFADSQRGWAMLDSPRGELLATTDGGRTWDFALGERTTPLQFSTPTDGWGSPYPPAAELAHTTDGGRTWTYIAVPAPAPGTSLGVGITPVAAIGNTVVAFGSNPTGNLRGLFFDVSTDGGRTWRLQTHMPPSTFGTTEPTVVRATDADHWQLSESNRLWTTADGGKTWTAVAEFAGISAVTDVRFLTPDVGFVSATGIGPTAYGTVVLRTADGGDTWTTVDTQAPPMGRHPTGVNFPGGIVGCPTHPLATPPAGDPPAGLVEAAEQYYGETPETIHAYHLGETSVGQFGGLFKFQVGSCGAPTMANGWVVEMNGPAMKGQAYIPRAYLAFAHYADGWHVFGRYP